IRSTHVALVVRGITDLARAAGAQDVERFAARRALRDDGVLAARLAAPGARRAHGLIAAPVLGVTERQAQAIGDGLPTRERISALLQVAALRVAAHLAGLA